MRFNIPQEVALTNRQAVVLSRPDVSASDGRGVEGFLYRPGHLLVAAEYEERFIAQMEGLNYVLVRHPPSSPPGSPPSSAPGSPPVSPPAQSPPPQDPPASTGAEFVEPDLLPNQFRVGARTNFGVVLFLVHRDQDIPALVTQMRDPRVTPPPVSPNHLLFGQIMGNPNGPAAPADSLDTDGDPSLGNGVSVAVLDTGIDTDKDGNIVHKFLRGHCDLIPPAAETPDGLPPDGILDDQGGHGTFIAGIIRQLAPGARVCIQRSLDSDGVGDEFRIARDLVDIYEQHQPQVINLSFGGYSQGDVPMLAFTKALGRLDPQTTVVVAAAGNQGSDRPLWPAALKGVLAVGALEFTEPDPEPAPLAGEDDPLERAGYSNFGWWVDLWAIGDWVSTFLWFDDAQRPPGDGSQLPARDFDGWAHWEGTSFATPTVSAAIAAVISACDVSPAEAAFRLSRGPQAPQLPGLGTFVDPAVLPRLRKAGFC